MIKHIFISVHLLVCYISVIIEYLTLLMLEAVGSSELLVRFCQAIQCHIPEDSNLQNTQNFNSSIIKICSMQRIFLNM